MEPLLSNLREGHPAPGSDLRVPAAERHSRCHPAPLLPRAPAVASAELRGPGLPVHLGGVRVVTGGCQGCLRAETTTRAPGPCLQGPQNGPLSSVLFVTHPQEYPHQTWEQLKAAFWVTYSQIPSDVSTWPKTMDSVFFIIYITVLFVCWENSLVNIDGGMDSWMDRR